MTKISRNDIYARSERGPDWLTEFLHSFAKSKPTTVQDIFNAIHNRQFQTVESVVQSYREQVGLDIISSDVDKKHIKQAAKIKNPNYHEGDKEALSETIKHIRRLKNQAKKGEITEPVEMYEAFESMLNSLLGDMKNKKLKRKASYRPLSVRHAMEKEKDVIAVIEGDKDLLEAIMSMCEHSGGHKSTHAIIDFLRNRLGHDLVSHTDRSLIDYIDKCKKRFDNNDKDCGCGKNVGLIGLSDDGDPEDTKADYATHDGAK